ncbi:DUF6206 family protein [Primorskyibacter sp. S187A]|uniref:DUF6206 family protein n=1 Tax=Primorskyibacter sp. S187A TaxID=3415130 RepID=UPI003C7AE71C
MTDLAALRAAITADSAARGAPISKLGFFCAPFRPTSGPLSDRVIKVYRGLTDVAALERLAACHADYVAAILATGVRMPETEFHLLEMEDGVRVPVVVQEALDVETLMRPRMIADPLPRTLEHMEAAGHVVARFWTRTDLDATRIGFHPSIRNLAIVDGEGVFFDTFPPLIHYSRDEMGAMLATYSDKPLMRVLAPFMRRKLTAVQDEWYSPPETLVGLVGSACRLRPDDAPAYLDWGRDFARREMTPWQDEILPELAEPPRLSGLWTGMRKVLGLQGEPNV